MKGKIRTFAALAGLAGLLSMLLMACGSPEVTPTPSDPGEPGEDREGLPISDDWDEVVAAAENERLSVFTHPGRWRQAVMDDFHAAYPNIEFEPTQARPSEFGPRIVEEQGAGIYDWDVVWGSTSNMTNVMQPAGTWQDIQPFFIHSDVLNDDNWRGPLWFWTSDEGPYVFVNSIAAGGSIWVNRDEVSEAEFNSLEDLMSSSVAGKIIIDNCSVPAHGMGTLMAVAAAQGFDFVETFLREQDYLFQETVRVLTEWVATGRYPIGIGVDSGHLLEFQEQGIGTNVEEMFLGTSATSAGIGVLKNAPNPNAAAVFVNWFLSEEGQRSFIERAEEFDSPTMEYNTRRSDLPVQYPDVYLDADELTEEDILTLQTGEGDGRYISWMMKSGREGVQLIRGLCADLQ